MTIIQAIILGIVQGVTEFLPISSSAHLVLVPFLLKWQFDPQQAFIFDVLVQLGTLVAVIVYFWKDLVEIIKAFFVGIKNKEPFKETNSHMAWMIILATIPAGIIGLLFNDKIEAAFGKPALIAVMLIITAILMIVAELLGKKIRSQEHMNFLDALIMGIFQAFAVFPGISRSGSTLSGGLFRQLERKTAARFSFLMSIPIMLAAGLMAGIDLVKLPNLSSFLPQMVLGLLVSGLVGYFAIAWLMRFLSQKPLKIFSIYCTVLAVIVLIVNYAR